MKVVWKYFVPLCIFLWGIILFFTNPNDPISSTVPIILGSYKNYVAAALIVVGFLLAIGIRRDKGNGGD